MSFSPSALLQLQILTDQTEDYTWGPLTNSLFERLEQSIAGEVDKTLLASDVTLNDTAYNGTESHKMVFVLSGAITANINVIVPTRTKLYCIRNTTTDGGGGPYMITVKTAAGTGVDLAHGQNAVLHCDGTNVEAILTTDPSVLSLWAGTSGGTATAYTITTTPSIPPVAGTKVSFIAHAACGDDATLAVNGATAANLALNGSNLVADDIKISTTVEALYTGSIWEVLSNGYGTVRTGSSDDNSFASLLWAQRATIFDIIYPVGSLYFNVSNATNPGTLLGVGTWVAHAEGRMLVGIGSGTDDNSEVRAFTGAEEAGEYNHTLTEDELASHNHVSGTMIPNSNSIDGGIARAVLQVTGSSVTANTGGDLAHTNMSPYTTVYIWRRTA